MPTIAGSEVAREQILELANALARNGADFTSRVLLDAITYKRDVVSLSPEGREELLAALASASAELDGLRDALERESLSD
jgi:hypothetical protein